MLKFFLLSYVRILLFFALLMTLSFAQAADLSGFPVCDSPACSSVAVKESWPQRFFEKFESVQFHGFKVTIPSNGIETRSNNRFRQFDFGEKRWISMSVFERSDTDEFFKASRYTMVDWADIVYNQTPDDDAPETDAEAYAWYSCLMTKVIFVGQNLVIEYKNLPYVVYSINDSLSGNKTLMIVSTKMPEVMLKMEVYGFNELEELSLIAGLSH